MLKAVCIAFLGALFSLIGTLIHPQSGHGQDTHTVADLASIEDRVQAVYKQVSPAIVRFGYGKDNKLHFGCGVIVSSEGHVAVSGPVKAAIQDDLINLRLVDGRRVNAKALGWSGEFKFGIVKIDEKGPWSHIDLSRRADARAGQLCVAIGYPQRSDVGVEERPSLRFGAITKSAVPTWLTSSYRFKAGAHCVFDLDGRLLGLTCITPVGGDPLQTSAELLKLHWDDLVAGKNLDRLRLRSHEIERGQPTEPPAAAARESAAGAIATATAAAVQIRDLGQKEGLASGVIVTPDGYVITCGHHGRLPGQKVDISLSDGRDASAIVVGTNLVADVGLMKITDKGTWPYARLGHSATMQPGDRCVLIGYPRAQPGREPWVLETRIIQPTQTLPARDEWYCQFWTSGFPNALGGASGGGVFDRQGRVIGVLLGGVGDEMQHARVELFRKQWDTLASGRPVDVLDSKPLTMVTAAFSHITTDLPPIAVEVLVDGKRRALGTIVGKNGLVLVKASVLVGTVSCRLADGRELSASVQKQSQEYDLAILKIDATDLLEARWKLDANIAPGVLIAALEPGKPPRAGIVTFSAQSKPSIFGTDILLRPESCGGPVIDRSGRVVGIAINCHTEVGGFAQSEVIAASIARSIVSD